MDVNDEVFDISGVPLPPLAHKMEMGRFITMNDNIYNNKLQLIMADKRLFFFSLNLTVKGCSAAGRGQQ